MPSEDVICGQRFQPFINHKGMPDCISVVVALRPGTSWPKVPTWALAWPPWKRLMLPFRHPIPHCGAYGWLDIGMDGGS